MATFINTTDTPTYGQWYTDPNTGKSWWLESRHFPRWNRMVCEMTDLDGFTEYFVFPY